MVESVSLEKMTKIFKWRKSTTIQLIPIYKQWQLKNKDRLRMRITRSTNIFSLMDTHPTQVHLSTLSIV